MTRGGGEGALWPLHENNYIETNGTTDNNPGRSGVIDPTCSHSRNTHHYYPRAERLLPHELRPPQIDFELRSPPHTHYGALHRGDVTHTSVWPTRSGDSSKC